MHVLYVQSRYFDLALMFSKVRSDRPRAPGLHIFEGTFAFHWTLSNTTHQVSSTFKVYVLPLFFIICYPAKQCLGNLRRLGSSDSGTIGAMFHHHKCPSSMPSG